MATVWMLRCISVPSSAGRLLRSLDIPANVAMCHSVNVGGLRTHVHRLTASLGQGNHILAVQETLVSRQAQRTLTQSLQADGMSVVWGTPAPIKVNRAGHWRVDRQHPGVAVIHSANLSVHSVSCITPAAQKWVQQGRMILVRVDGGAKPLYLLNVYAPAGNAQRRLRALFLDQLLLELAHWHLCDMIVMGDVQGKWSDDFRYLQLALHGWRLPLPLTHDGNLAHYTYRCAGTYTFLDMVMCSPDIDPCIQHVTCHEIEGLLHSLISLQLRLDTVRPHQRVAYPPRLESSHGLLSPHDWDLTIANIREGVAQCLATFEGAEWIPVDSDIDSIWEVFSCSYRDHLYRSGVRALGQEGTPLPDLQAVGKCGAHRATCRRQKARSSRDRRLYQAVGWLTSLARNENPQSMQDKLRQNEEVICECFQLTRAAFRDALNSPSSFVSPWKEAHRRYRHRNDKKKLRSWRSKLFTSKARPSRTLFRWLRSIPPVPTLTSSWEGKIVVGPHDFFEANRKYWSQIMCTDTRGRDRAMCESDYLLRSSDPLPQDTTTLCHVAKGMRRQAAPGLDLWPVQVLDFLVPKAAEALLLIFQCIEATGRWPRQWVSVRTHIAPKDDRLTPPLEAHRPLSVLSIWYRLWSAYRIAMLPQEFYDIFRPELRGGLPHRTIEDLVAGPLLCYEAYETHSWHGEPATPLHMLSLDASKCFDRITFESASREGRRCGLPSRLLGTLLGFWSVKIRFFSGGGYLDEIALLPQNGVPQGCPLSALLCNTIVQGWHGAIEHTPCHTGAFLDDGVLWAHNHPDLMSGWENKPGVGETAGVVLNTSKSCHIQVPPSPETLSDGVEMVPKTSALVTLGVDFATKANSVLERQVKRTQQAATTAQKVAQLALPPRTAQCLVESVVLTQFAHHLQLRPIPRRQIARLRSLCQKACSIHRRAHSYHLVQAVLCKSHRTDPEDCAFFVHGTTLADALRPRRAAYDWWFDIRSLRGRARPRGPWGTLLIYLERYQITLREDSMVLYHEKWGSCRWLEVQRGTLAHFLRDVIRFRHLLQAQASRPLLEGVVATDVTNSARLYRRDKNDLRAELASILTNGLWTQVRRHQAKLVPSPRWSCLQEQSE